jgi:hypothetical protein
MGVKNCSVKAKGQDGTYWQWTFTKGKMSDLEESWVRDAQNMGIPIDVSTAIALFQWQHTGEVTCEKEQMLNPTFYGKKAQILKPDGGLYILPPECKSASLSRYLDFASIRAMPQELSYQTSKKLTKALQIFNPQVTDIRISNIENGLSVIFDGDRETTLDSVGNGAVTWANTLISIFEIDEYLKNTEKSRNPVLILIDGIGAGIHYSAMSEIWKYLKAFSEQHPNVQFVTTSHSDDCVRAFCDAFTDKEQAGCVVRLHKSSENKIISTHYESKQFERIVSGEWEVRG